ncbi:protein disulfide oxidoreductase [Saccharothrix deserti]|uniref:protein disulfide oxidoreductase n=1 Tax=Saccharothrix deserti TaxID=2593674 RepID=UPI00131D12B2|nr:protein disulfide oxidoreductase [Saccharothrix deserti]
MLRKSAWCVTVLAFVVGCGSPAPTAGQASTTTPPAVGADTTQSSTAPGTAAPAAPVAEQLRFAAKTVDGKDFSGESLAGKPAALWFWAPWCPKCQREAPGVAAVAKDNAAVTFVGVAALDQVPAMQQFVQRFELGGFAHIADIDGAVWKRFGVTAQPAYAFVGRDGNVEVVPGQLSEQELRERVAAIAGT